MKTNGYQMKEEDLLYSLVPCTSKSSQGFTNSSRSKSSSFLNGPNNYYYDLTNLALQTWLSECPSLHPFHTYFLVSFCKALKKEILFSSSRHLECWTNNLITYNSSLKRPLILKSLTKQESG